MSESSNKIKNQGRLALFFRNNKYIFISGLAAFLITQLVAYCYNLVPYGDMTILRMDLYHQYGPLFAELYDRLTSGESLVYSWNSGLGMTFLGNFFNYLSSPLTLIVLLFGHENITEAISCLIMLKAVLSACSFTYYLKASQNEHNAVTAGFGVLYAFCGYFVAYYWNLMWLDAMVLFPIIILGIERIIKKGKPSLYCVSLAVMIFANYYMAFMVCIFSVLYFLTYYFANYPLSKKFDDNNFSDNILKRIKNSVFISSGIKFAFYSVVAALLASITILPLLSILSSSSATSSSAPTEFKKYFTAFDFLCNHLASTDATIRSSGDDVLPNVYCGVLTLLLVPLFLFAKKISVREKASYVILLGVIYASFNINYLNYIWHGLHFPNDLPYRFSFMYSFILLVIAYKAFKHLREYTGRQILACGVGLVGFIVLAEEITSKNLDDTSLAISLVFAVGYTVILYLFKDKRFASSAVAVLLLCSIASEIALGNTNNYSMNQSKTNYTVDYEDFSELKERLDEYDGGFYRMELTDLRTRMDPCWFDYNGVSTFSSMANESVANLMQDIGMYGNYINSYTYYSQTPVFNAMFALKYIVNNTTDEMNANLLDELFTVNDFTAFQNKYSLSVAFAANAEVKDWDSSSYDDPFKAQSELFKAASGVDGVFTKLSFDDITYSNINEILITGVEEGKMKFSKIVDGESGSICFEITPETEQNVYIYIDSSSVESVTASSLVFSKTVDTLDEGYIVDLGLRPAGETIYVDMSISDSDDTGSIEFYAYGLNEEKFIEGYNNLKSGDFTITEYSDTLLTGTITSAQDGVVFTSIPYDTNWGIYVDGVRVSSSDIFTISGGLLGFNISAGEHTVTFRYISSGLMAGEFISISTILIATIIIIMKRRRVLFFRRRRDDKWARLNGDGFRIDVEECFADLGDTPETEPETYSPPNAAPSREQEDIPAEVFNEGSIRTDNIDEIPNDGNDPPPVN